VRVTVVSPLTSCCALSASCNSYPSLLLLGCWLIGRPMGTASGTVVLFFFFRKVGSTELSTGGNISITANARIESFRTEAEVKMAEVVRGT
jgi:hypothetical protein